MRSTMPQMLPCQLAPPQKSCALQQIPSWRKRCISTCPPSRQATVRMNAMKVLALQVASMHGQGPSETGNVRLAVMQQHRAALQSQQQVVLRNSVSVALTAGQATRMHGPMASLMQAAALQLESHQAHRVRSMSRLAPARQRVALSTQLWAAPTALQRSRRQQRQAVQ